MPTRCQQVSLVLDRRPHGFGAAVRRRHVHTQICHEVKALVEGRAAEVRSALNSRPDAGFNDLRLRAMNRHSLTRRVSAEL